MKTGKLFIITGTSAVGKTSVANNLLKISDNLFRSLTYTSRPPRSNETNHQDYHFISENEFKNKIDNDEFLEWANNYGNLYGTDKEDIKKMLAEGKNVLVVIDIKGALNIKKQMPHNSLTIFILPESIAQLKKRFLKRQDTSAEAIKTRLETAEWELKQAKLCDYQIINKENQLNHTVQEVYNIINNR